MQKDVKIEYKGFLIKESKSIHGKLFYPNGTSVPWSFKKISIKSIDEFVKQDSSKFNIIH